MKIDKIAPLGVTPLPAELNPNAGTQNPHCGSRQPYSRTQTSHFESHESRFESHESRCRQVFELHKYPDKALSSWEEHYKVSLKELRKNVDFALRIGFITPPYRRDS